MFDSHSLYFEFEIYLYIKLLRITICKTYDKHSLFILFMVWDPSHKLKFQTRKSIEMIAKLLIFYVYKSFLKLKLCIIWFDYRFYLIIFLIFFQYFLPKFKIKKHGKLKLKKYNLFDLFMNFFTVICFHFMIFSLNLSASLWV